MKTNIQYQPQKYGKVKLLIAVLLILGAIAQITGGFRMTDHNMNLAHEIPWQAIDTAGEQEKIISSVTKDKTIFWYTERVPVDSDNRYLVCLTPQHKMMLIVSNSEDSPVSFDFMAMMMAPEEIVGEGAEGYDFFGVGGYVRPCTPALMDSVRHHLPKELYTQYNLTDDSFSPVYIECSDAEDMNGPYPVALIIGNFVLAVAMLIAAVLLVRQSVNNFVYRHLVRHPSVTPQTVVPPMETFTGYDSGTDAYKDPFEHPYDTHPHDNDL